MYVRRPWSPTTHTQQSAHAPWVTCDYPCAMCTRNFLITYLPASPLCVWDLWQTRYLWFCTNLTTRDRTRNTTHMNHIDKPFRTLPRSLWRRTDEEHFHTTTASWTETAYHWTMYVYGFSVNTLFPSLEYFYGGHWDTPTYSATHNVSS